MTEHPQAIGSIWVGDKYIHGPRRKRPNNFVDYRLTPPTKRGVRQVLGLNKKTGKWERQSTLYPKEKFQEISYSPIERPVVVKKREPKLKRDKLTGAYYMTGKPKYKKVWKPKRKGGGQRYIVRIR
jgi:hypothetical protein